MKRDPQALQAREHDVLIIGGGIAGAWVVFEAASRGISAALIELDDFGQATSWSSLKTAHGGLRHLQRLDLPGFRESVRERRALLRVAPEIVRPLSFAIAATGVVDPFKYLLGGLANDILSFDRNEGVRADRFVGPSRVTKGAFIWQDAQITHTERLLMALLQEAADAGAAVINRSRIESCERRAKGFEFKARDLVDGSALSIRARTVVNASGAGLEEVARLLGETCGSPALIRGVNVVLGGDLTPSIALGARDRDRFLFLVPWLGHTILGTAYDDGGRDVADLVQDLMEGGRRAFPSTRLDEADIKAIHAGHVPGAPNGEPIYRSKLIGHKDPRIVSLLTAKYTTARATAEAVVTRLAPSFSTPPGPSVSAHQTLRRATPLVGSRSDRMERVRAEEMALSDSDALRGRLIEGAFGERLP